MGLKSYSGVEVSVIGRLPEKSLIVGACCIQKCTVRGSIIELELRTGLTKAQKSKKEELKMALKKKCTIW